MLGKPMFHEFYISMFMKFIRIGWIYLMRRCMIPFGMCGN